MLSMRHRFPSVTTLAGIWRRFDGADERRTASVVPLMAFPRTSFFAFAGTVCAAAGMAASTDARPSRRPSAPTSSRNSLRFNRMFNLAGNINPPS